MWPLSLELTQLSLCHFRTRCSPKLNRPSMYFPVTYPIPKARVCDIMPGLHHSLFVSIGNMADTGYYTIFMPGNQSVLVVDGNGHTISITRDAVLRGCRGHGVLWRVLVDDAHMAPLSNNQLQGTHNNVFNLSSSTQTIRYLHNCAGFPTRRILVKATRKINFASWPILTVKNTKQALARVRGDYNWTYVPPTTGPEVHKKAASKHKIVDTSRKTDKKEQDVYIKAIDL